MKKITQKVLTILLAILITGSLKTNAQIMVYHQGFDSLSVLLNHGWEVKNKSFPLGPGTSGGAGEWIQGDAATFGAPAYSGPANSFVQVDYSSTDPRGVISDWLLSDTVTLRNGDTVSLYTVSYNSTVYPDNLECRFSAMGASDSIGNDSLSSGNFSTWLFAVNPYFDTISYPSLTGNDTLQKHTWTKFYGIVNGLSGYTSCRLALRYFVEDGGVGGTRSSTIGVDSLTVTRGITTGIKENSMEVGMQLYPNPANENVYLNLFSKGDYLVNVYNNIGQKVLSFKTESNKTIDISAFPSALYIVQVIDAKTGNNKSMRFIKE